MNRTQHNRQEGFQWGPFILGILSIILAFFAFNHPVVSIVSVTILFGVGAILKGLYEIFVRRKVRQFAGYSSVFVIVIGIIDILIGIFFLFNRTGGLIALPLVFAFWIIFDSIGAIITASVVKKYSNTQFWFTVIIGILGVVLGFLLLNNPSSAYLTIAALVGIYFMVNGILNIVYAF